MELVYDCFFFQEDFSEVYLSNRPKLRVEQKTSYCEAITLISTSYQPPDGHNRNNKFVTLPNLNTNDYSSNRR